MGCNNCYYLRYNTIHKELFCKYGQICFPSSKYFQQGFPILDDSELKKIPWDVIKNHEEQALKNHDQTLERLRERGGLSWVETACVLSDKSFDRKMTEEEAIQIVSSHVPDFWRN
jgi:hypothetical protein